MTYQALRVDDGLHDEQRLIRNLCIFSNARTHFQNGVEKIQCQRMTFHWVKILSMWKYIWSTNEGILIN